MVGVSRGTEGTRCPEGGRLRLKFRQSSSHEDGGGRLRVGTEVSLRTSTTHGRSWTGALNL